MADIQNPMPDDRAASALAYAALLHDDYAVYDPLTGLLNRRGLYESLQAAIVHAEASRTPLVLMFIDLDDFKNANDVGGHRTGDEILVSVSRTLVEQMRKSELVARLGGAASYRRVCGEQSRLCRRVGRFDHRSGARARLG